LSRLIFGNGKSGTERFSLGSDAASLLGVKGVPMMHELTEISIWIDSTQVPTLDLEIVQV
jgi:hypothetical protein